MNLRRIGNVVSTIGISGVQIIHMICCGKMFEISCYICESLPTQAPCQLKILWHGLVFVVRLWLLVVLVEFSSMLEIETVVLREVQVSRLLTLVECSNMFYISVGCWEHNGPESSCTCTCI